MSQITVSHTSRARGALLRLMTRRCVTVLLERLLPSGQSKSLFLRIGLEVVEFLRCRLGKDTRLLSNHYYNTEGRLKRGRCTHHFVLQALTEQYVYGMAAQGICHSCLGTENSPVILSRCVALNCSSTPAHVFFSRMAFLIAALKSNAIWSSLALAAGLCFSQTVNWAAFFWLSLCGIAMVDGIAIENADAFVSVKRCGVKQCGVEQRRVSTLHVYRFHACITMRRTFRAYAKIHHEFVFRQLVRPTLKDCSDIYVLSLADNVRYGFVRVRCVPS